MTLRLNLQHKSNCSQARLIPLNKTEAFPLSKTQSYHPNNQPPT